MSEIKIGSTVRFKGEGTVVSRRHAGASQRLQEVEVKVFTPAGGTQYVWVAASEIEEVRPTASEFLNTLEPGTMFRNPRTGSEFVMLRGGRYIRTKVGYNAAPGISQGTSYHADSGGVLVKPNPFEVM